MSAIDDSKLHEPRRSGIRVDAKLIAAQNVGRSS